MNTGRAHGLFVHNNENCGGYNMIGRPLSHLKCLGSWSLLHQFTCVLSLINLGVVHRLKDTRFETIVHIEITQKIPHSSFFFKLKLLKYVGDCCKICAFQKFKSIIGFYGTVQS